MGVITEKSSIGAGLGYEGSGVITKVGAGIKTHRVGDRVIMSSSGSFTTTKCISQKLCARMPDSMTFEEGATISAAYCTAIYCLMHAGRLSKGQVRALQQHLLQYSTNCEAAVSFDPFSRRRCWNRRSSNCEDDRGQSRIPSIVIHMKTANVIWKDLLYCGQRGKSQLLDQSLPYSTASYLQLSRCQLLSRHHGGDG